MTMYPDTLFPDPDPFRSLAIAVLLQAAEDWRSLKIRLLYAPDDLSASRALASLERNFRSGPCSLWLSLLSNTLTGSDLLTLLRKDFDSQNIYNSFAQAESKGVP